MPTEIEAMEVRAHGLHYEIARLDGELRFRHRQVAEVYEKRAISMMSVLCFSWPDVFAAVTHYTEAYEEKKSMDMIDRARDFVGSDHFTRTLVYPDDEIHGLRIRLDEIQHWVLHRIRIRSSSSSVAGNDPRRVATGLAMAWSKVRTSLVDHDVKKLDLDAIDEILRSNAIALGLPVSKIDAAREDRRLLRTNHRILRSCVYTEDSATFVVVFENGALAKLPVSMIDLPNGANVVAWRIDDFRRGVIVDFEVEGKVSSTSFSADLALYESNPEYRAHEQAQARIRTSGQPDASKLFASRVREAREALGWTAAELGRQTGIAPSNIHRIETGKHSPSQKLVFLMAETLRRPISWFYDEEEMR